MPGLERKPSTARLVSVGTVGWKAWLEHVVGRIFYTHGLFCATHPILIFSFVFVVVMTCTLPLLTLSAADEVEPRAVLWTGPFVPDSTGEDLGGGSNPLLAVFSVSLEFPPIISTNQELLRAALGLVFSLHSTVVGYTIEGSPRPLLPNLCYPSPAMPLRCIVNSPVDFWQHNVTMLQSDGHILGTLSEATDDSYGNPIYLDALLADMERDQDDNVSSFGGVVITVVLQASANGSQADHVTYVNGLVASLAESVHWALAPRPDTITHCFYEVPTLELSADFGFLACTYVIVFLYISFSIGKFHMVKSKYGLGFTAVVTVVCSLLMAIGICTAFGMAPTLMAVEVIPFLIIAIGVENIFYITHAVVSTNLDLPVRQRIAHGMAQTAAPVLLSLVAELSLAALGVLTSIPALREFCIFAFVSVVADFFMQVTFFITVLSIDIRRMELTDLQKHHQEVVEQYEGSSVPNGTPSGGSVAEGSTGVGGPVKRNYSYHSLDAAGLKAGPAGIRDCPGLCKAVTAVLFVVAVTVGLLLRGTGPLELLRGPVPSVHQPGFSLYRLLHETHGLELDGRYIDTLPPARLMLHSLPINGSLVDIDSLVHQTSNTAIQSATLFPPRSLATTFRRVSTRLSQADLKVVGVCVLLFCGAMGMVYGMLGALPQRRKRATPTPTADRWANSATAVVCTGMVGGETGIECVCRDGPVLVSCATDSVLKVWDGDTAECIQTVNLNTDLPDPHTSTSSSSEGPTPRTGQVGVWCVTYHAGTVVAGCSNGWVVVWSKDGEFQESVNVLTGHSDAVTCLACSDGTIVSGSLDGTVRIWARQGVTAAGNVAKTKLPLSVAATSGGRQRPGILKWGSKHTVRGHTRGVSVLALCGHTVVSGSHDRTLRIISLATGVCLYTLYGHEGDITAVHMDPPLLVSGSSDTTLRLWEMASGSLLGALEGHSDSVVCIQSHFPTTPRLIASTSLDECRLWDSELQCCLMVFPLDINGPPTTVDIYGGLLVIPDGDWVCMYDVDSGECVRRVSVGVDGGGALLPSAYRYVSFDGRALVCTVGSVLKMIALASPTPEKSL